MSRSLSRTGSAPSRPRAIARVHMTDRPGVSRQTVNALENGRYDPSLPLAFKIAEVFGEPIESLFLPAP